MIAPRPSPPALRPFRTVRPVLAGEAEPGPQAGRHRLARAAPPLELVTLRPARALAALAAPGPGPTWVLSPRLDVHLALSTVLGASSPAPGRERTTGPAAPPAPYPAVALPRSLRPPATMVVVRCEPAAGPPAPQAGPAAVAPRPGVERAAPRTVPAALAPASMVLARPAAAALPALPAGAPGTLARTAPGAAPVPGVAPPPPPRADPVQLERLTDQVVRALDHRLVAWRERMGRP